MKIKKEKIENGLFTKVYCCKFDRLSDYTNSSENEVFEAFCLPHL